MYNKDIQIYINWLKNKYYKKRKLLKYHNVKNII